MIKVKFKAIVLDYYGRDVKLRHREILVCLNKEDFLDTIQDTKQIRDTKGAKKDPQIS